MQWHALSFDAMICLVCDGQSAGRKLLCQCHALSLLYMATGLCIRFRDVGDQPGRAGRLPPAGGAPAAGAAHLEAHPGHQQWRHLLRQVRACARLQHALWTGLPDLQCLINANGGPIAGYIWPALGRIAPAQRNFAIWKGLEPHVAPVWNAGKLSTCLHASCMQGHCDAVGCVLRAVPVHLHSRARHDPAR